MSIKREINKTAIRHAASKRAKFIQRSATGLECEDMEGNTVYASSPYLSDIAEQAWLTLLRTDGGWVVQGTATSAPTSSHPSGEV